MSPCFFLFRPSAPGFRAACVFVFCAVASTAFCQKQEKVMTDHIDRRPMSERLDNPDLTLKSAFADRGFTAGGKFNTDKSATIREFPFVRSANGREGFRTKDFAGSKGFRTKDFAGNKPAREGGKTFAQTDKSYGTKTFDVREDRMANKTYGTRDFVPGEKTTAPNGKRQDTIDAMMEKKNLTIDEVRELLNKNR
jgi:hypothetical protein